MVIKMGDGCPVGKSMELPTCNRLQTRPLVQPIFADLSGLNDVVVANKHQQINELGLMTVRMAYSVAVSSTSTTTL